MKRLNRGFTLIELMITITLICILLGFGIPAFRDFTRNNSVTAVQNDLVTAMNLARSEALKRNRNVTVCATTDRESCGDADNWNEGWIAFVDPTNPGVVDKDEEILQAWPSANTSLAFDANGSSFIQYEPTGMTTDKAQIDVFYKGCEGRHLRRIVVLATGGIEGRTEECPTT
jgi:type IV fimbrial biogenesis protein FimT